MKGDFSKREFGRNHNFNGVLQQQGRVLLDADWNAQTQIATDWQDTAGKDALGPGVAAVPAEDRDAFKVISAEVADDPSKVAVTVSPGRVWADGLLVHLEKATQLLATYLEPPIQESPEVSNGAGNRDAVILEVWRESINGFQLPEELIEPALGGPDTTERVHTAIALKLYRLAPGESCENIRHKLQDDFSKKGWLSVSLRPLSESDDACPTMEGGGYTGFEHHLYRIEIAHVNNDTPPMFKWSRFNGGLVGRGTFQAASGEEPAKVNITANLQAISTSGLKTCYLEALEYVEHLGHWQVIYGAEATLSGNEIALSNVPTFRKFPASSEPAQPVFFRLWDGIENIINFGLTLTGPHELQDGIHLEFDNPPSAVYLPGDYWTFPVRAGEMRDSSNVFRAQPPEGIHYHRVPIAELHWKDTPPVEIEDCRRVFRPLTNQQGCCSFTVGDGISTHGDYNSIEEAIAKLPWWGGEICLLPGIHLTRVEMQGKFNITIKGCGLQTWVFSRPQTDNEFNRVADIPLFRVVNSWYIALENMTLVKPGGTAIEMQGCRQVEIKDNHILAYKHAIDVRSYVSVDGAEPIERESANLHIHQNKIFMVDRIGGDVAIFLHAEDGLVERNLITVIPAGTVPPRDDIPEGTEETDPADDCVEEPDAIELRYLMAYLNHGLRVYRRFLPPPNPFRALGGIQIASGSERIKIFENRIRGGDGNGITLGSNLDVSGFPEESEADVHVIEHTKGQIHGRVLSNNTPVGGITLLFTREEATYSVISGENGYFYTDPAETGSYRVSVVNRGFKIDPTRRDDSEEEEEYGIYHYVHLLPVDVEIDDSVMDFIYDVVIAGNEIFQMGLSGIGTPQRNLAELLQLAISYPHALDAYPLIHILATRFGVVSGLVVDLTIRDNHIFRCMQNPFGAALQLLALLRGEGGISLGLCENVMIHDNRVEDNGQSHIEPICGLFISYAVQADISHNQIVNNGPLNPGVGILTHRGIRGGVIIRAGISLMIHGALEAVGLMRVSESLASLDPNIVWAISMAAATGGYAVRVHDNLVKQPVGQALRMFALGPVSVVNNQFTTDFSRSDIGPRGVLGPDRLAGSVLLINLGESSQRYLRTAQGQLSMNPLTATPAIFNGHTLFSNNQTRLGLNFYSSNAQLIATWDDLGFHNNQADVVAEFSLPLRCNTRLLAYTLRATDNRMKEPIQQGRYSLRTLTSALNNTSNNQGNNLIQADSLGAVAIVESGNQQL